jgi:hypothetical protein
MLSVDKTNLKMKKSNVRRRSRSFHESVRPALIFGQFFAMLPVNGISSHNGHNLRFRWLSIKTIYSITFLTLGTIESCLVTRRVFVIGFTIVNVETVIFYVISMMRAFIIFRLATKWSSIMDFWREREDVFLSDPYVTKGWSLRTKIVLVFYVMVACVLGRKQFAQF